jgi:hypothetical protein
LPFDEVDARRGLDNSTDLARLESESSIFKLLLHLSTSKEATGIISIYKIVE